MQIVWSKVIENFAPAFGLSKAQIEDTYNKPDKSKMMGGTYVTVKFYSGYAVIITFAMELDKIHFLNAYKVFPDMLTVDVAKADPIQILVNFMEGYGKVVDLPGVGKVKTYVNEDTRQFYQGMLDIEKYGQALASRV